MNHWTADVVLDGPLAPGLDVGSACRAGQALTAGSIDPTQIAQSVGSFEAARFIATRLVALVPDLPEAGATLLARQFAQGAVEITNDGDLDVEVGEILLIATFLEANEEAIAGNYRPATGQMRVCGARVLLALES